jgi:hypothetical protein
MALPVRSCALQGPFAEAAVDFRKLGNVLMAAGVAVLVGAVIWWFAFYSSVVREIGKATGSTGDGSVLDVLSCLYSASGVCALVSAVATIAGRSPYEPMLFWFGLGGLLLGAVIRFTAKPAGAA